MADPVRLAFVGAGGCLSVSFGPVLRFIDGIDVVAAVDPDPNALRSARDDYGIMAGYHDLASCLEHESIDAALIAAPVFLHRDLAVACAEAGVHVLLEKPMARTVGECDEIIVAHERAGTVLMVAFMKRFNRSLRVLTEMLEAGVVGRAMGLRHNWDWGGNEAATFTPHWRGQARTLGGQWQDHGSHSVDLAHWWLGPVRSVMASFDITEPYFEVENEYNVICTHASGARSTHSSSQFYHLRDEERYLVLGETGTLEARHYAGSWQHTSPYEMYLHRWGHIREDHTPPFGRSWLDEGRDHGQYRLELQHFVDCIRQGSEPLTDGASGRAVVEVLTAAYLSALRQAAIELPLDPEADFEPLFASIPRRLPPRYQEDLEANP